MMDVERIIKGIEASIHEIQLALLTIKKVIDDPYADAKSAFADGELQENPLNKGWRDWSISVKPAWNMPPENYRRKPALPDWVTDDSTRFTISASGRIGSTYPSTTLFKTECWLMGMLFKTEAEAIAHRDQILAQVAAERASEVREVKLYRNFSGHWLNADLHTPTDPVSIVTFREFIQQQEEG